MSMPVYRPKVGKMKFKAKRAPKPHMPKAVRPAKPKAPKKPKGWLL
jgi:hypothetical protein